MLGSDSEQDDVAEKDDQMLISHLAKEMNSHQTISISYRAYQRKRDNSSEDPYHPTKKPYLVSIGPYNHGNFNLRYMQSMKWKCLKFLTRNSWLRFPTLLKNINAIDRDARRFYGEAEALEVKMKMNGKKFTKILILDGFFIICYVLSKLDQVGLIFLIKSIIFEKK